MSLGLAVVSLGKNRLLLSYIRSQKAERESWTIYWSHLIESFVCCFIIWIQVGYPVCPAEMVHSEVTHDSLTPRFSDYLF